MAGELDLGLAREPQPISRRSRRVIGIDLGTTNSYAAVAEDGHPRLIPARRGHGAVPSVVALDARRRLLVGHPARAQVLSNPREAIHGAKRLVGRRFDSRLVQHLRRVSAYSIVEGEGGLAAVEIAGRRLSPEQVSALVLRELKDAAQEHLGEVVDRAVVAVPAHYREHQREAVRRAGALAGLRVERIVDEPTAAAIAFACVDRRPAPRRVLVYDLGGATFDASVLELREGGYAVVSASGDAFLGGADFDRRIVARLLERFADRFGVRFDGDPIAFSRLVDAAERCKCELSEREEARVHLPALAVVKGRFACFEATLSRAEVAGVVEPLVARTLEVVREALAARRLRPEDVDEVVLAGGQSRMPLVEQEVRTFFGKPPSRAVCPEEAVAVGAALVARACVP